MAKISYKSNKTITYINSLFTDGISTLQVMNNST